MTISCPSPAPLLVIDCDDVVANIRETVAQAMMAETGQDRPWQQWDTYDLSKIYGLTNWSSSFLEHRVLERATPEPGARLAIRTAREMGYRVMMLTARGWHPDGEALTRDWLEAHQLEVDELQIVPVDASKVQALKGVAVEYFLDDNPRHIREAEYADHIFNPILVSRPWNTRTTARHRVESLLAFTRFLRCQGAREGQYAGRRLNGGRAC